MKKLFLPIALMCCLLISSCKKDTCNSKLGDTFQSLETPVINENISGINELMADMLTLDDLTNAYFEATELIGNNQDRFGNDWQNDASIIEGIAFQKTHFKIKFKEVDLVDYGKIVLHFRLRDRKEFIDCDHGGSGDTYFLDIEFSVAEELEGELEVNNFQWEEDFKAGPY